MTLAGKAYWIVGASEGLGRALALELDRRGVRLVISARSQSRLEELAAELRHPASICCLDVSDSVAVTKAVEQVDGIDGVIYAAALYEPMTAQNWNVEESELIAEVNFLGGIRVLGGMVSQFLARNAGHIVVIGSLSGYRGLPGALAYGASKAGLMHLTEAIYADLWKTPIKTQLFNMGFIETRLTAKNGFKMPFIMSPEKAAMRIANGMEKRRFKFDIPVLFSLAFRFSRVLPQFLYTRLFAK